LAISNLTACFLLLDFSAKNVYFSITWEISIEKL